jgi:hypothetical protein
MTFPAPVLDALCLILSLLSATNFTFLPSTQLFFVWDLLTLQVPIHSTTISYFRSPPTDFHIRHPVLFLAYLFSTFWTFIFVFASFFLGGGGSGGVFIKFSECTIIWRTSRGCWSRIEPGTPARQQNRRAKQLCHTLSHCVIHCKKRLTIFLSPAGM